MIKTFFAIFIMLISFCLWASDMEFTQPIKVDQRIEGNNIQPQIFDNPWDTVWTRTYGENYDDKAYAVAADSQGYYVIAGVNDSYEGACSPFPCQQQSWWEIWLLKIDPLTGDTIWARKYFEDIGGEEMARNIVVDRDGYYVIVGYNTWYSSGPDIFILKINPSTGDTIWTKTYGGSEFDFAYDVTVDDSGYYVVVGSTESFSAGWHDYWVLKIEPTTGDTVWTRTYGGSQEDRAYAVTVDKDGHYVVGGNSRSLGASWVLKIDASTGDTIWTCLIPPCGPYSMYPAACDITTGPNGFYYLTGEIAQSSSPTAPTDIWVGKLDPLQGDTIWTKTYGSPSHDYSYGIAMGKFGDCVVAGYEMNSVCGWILKIDSSTGDTIWTVRYGEGVVKNFRDIAVDDMGYYIAVGYVLDPSYYSDFWILKLVGDMDTFGIEENILSPKSFVFFQATPNPFRNKVDITFSIGQSAEGIELKIFDVTGRLIRSFPIINLCNQNKSVVSVCWDGTDNSGNKVQSGVYFCRLNVGDNQSTKKLLRLQ